jgi:hypothetical protein
MPEGRGLGQYIIALAKLAGVKTLNVVRWEAAADEVGQWGGDRLILQGGKLHKNLAFLRVYDRRGRTVFPCRVINAGCRSHRV